MLEELPEDAEEGARQSAFRAGYRTGFGDGFDAADKVNEASRRKGAAEDAQGPPDRKDADGAHAGAGAGGGESDEGAKKDAGQGPDAGAPPLYKRPALVLAAIVLVVAAIVAGTLFVLHSRKHETTDDAFIDGTASQIAAQAAGRVVKLHVTDNQEVRRGDPIVDIDSADVAAKVDQAGAQLQAAQSQALQAQAQVDGQKANAAQAAAQARQAEAESANAQQDLARFQGVDPDAVSRQQADQAVAQARGAKAKVEAARSGEAAALAQLKAAGAQVKAADAQVATARANLETARIQLGYTRVVAPIAGRVTKRSVDVGNVISVGQPILAIVSPDLWVTANFKETQLTKMRLRQPVTVEVDAFPDVKFAAHVDSVQRATGAYFSALPAENATGNYVKVTQRVPVKIVFDRPEELQRYPIGPGMSVTPSVDVD
ncbi:MAG: HlyD family secretion protein [Burkholderiaceae bacterium]